MSNMKFDLRAFEELVRDNHVKIKLKDRLNQVLKDKPKIGFVEGMVNLM